MAENLGVGGVLNSQERGEGRDRGPSPPSRRGLYTWNLQMLKITCSIIILYYRAFFAIDFPGTFLEPSKMHFWRVLRHIANELPVANSLYFRQYESIPPPPPSLSLQTCSLNQTGKNHHGWFPWSHSLTYIHTSGEWRKPSCTTNNRTEQKSRVLWNGNSNPRNWAYNISRPYKHVWSMNLNGYQSESEDNSPKPHRVCCLELKTKDRW